MSRFESFKNLAAALQSLVLAAGVIIGGIWTFYTFRALSVRVRANNALSAEQLSLERRARIAVAIEIEQASDPTAAGGSLALVTVTLSNAGSRHVYLDTTENAVISLARVAVSDDSTPEFTDRQDRGFMSAAVPKLPLKSLVLAAGAQASFPAAFAISKPGLYYVSAHVPAGQRELDEATALGHPVGKRGGFDASRYVVVGPPPDMHRTPALSRTR
jgi:hypothetical protein